MHHEKRVSNNLPKTLLIRLYPLLIFSLFLNSASMEKPAKSWWDLRDISPSIRDWLELEKYKMSKAQERHIDARKTYNPPSLLFLAAFASKNKKRKFTDESTQSCESAKNCRIKIPQELDEYLTFMYGNQHAIKNKFYGTVLLNAAKCNCIQIIPDLIALRVDLDYRELLEKADSDRYLDRYGKNAIKVARERGHTQFAEFLIKLGADPKEIDEDPDLESHFELYLRAAVGSVKTNENSKNN